MAAVDVVGRWGLLRRPVDVVAGAAGKVGGEGAAGGVGERAGIGAGRRRAASEARSLEGASVPGRVTGQGRAGESNIGDVGEGGCVSLSGREVSQRPPWPGPPPGHLPVRLSGRLPIRLSACPPVRLSDSPTLRLSRLSDYPPASRSACLLVGGAAQTNQQRGAKQQANEGTNRRCRLLGIFPRPGPARRPRRRGRGGGGRRRRAVRRRARQRKSEVAAAVHGRPPHGKRISRGMG